MTNMMLRMRACVQVVVGMRVYYDCPSAGGSFEATKFFKKYRGAQGTIVGFPTKYVGLLDNNGRLPGVYYQTDCVNVRFDGEDQSYEELNIDHFVLTGTTTTVNPETPLTHQRAGDLPHTIRFYPGDVVCKADDLLGTKRLVQAVNIQDSGSVVYILAETEDDRKAREAEGAEFSLERTENCSERDLKMISPGNLHWLYVDSANMAFESSKDEVLFWAQDGLTSKVFTRDGGLPIWEYSYKQARKMLTAGEGDVIIRPKQAVMRKGDDCYQVRRLHDCFEQHRDRVRAFALELEIPPSEGQKKTVLA